MTARRALTLLVVAAVLGGLAYLQFRTWRDFDWNTFKSQTQGMDFWRVGLAVFLIYSTYYLRALRWKVMLRPAKRLPARTLVAAQVIGFTGVALLGRPGDLVRPYLVAKKHDLTVSSQMAVLAVERICDIGAFAILLISALLFARDLQRLAQYQQFRTAGIALAVMTLVIVGLLFLVWRNGAAVGDWLRARLHRIAPKAADSLREKVLHFSDGLHTIDDLKSFVQILLLSLAIWLVIATAYLQVLHAYSGLDHMSLGRVVLVMSASIAGSMLQLPVVGGGSQLGTIAVMERVLLLPKELALSCGIMLWLITFAAVIPLGLICARIEHVNLRNTTASR
jgi:glycosyltransferase 2 family protein